MMQVESLRQVLVDRLGYPLRDSLRGSLLGTSLWFSLQDSLWSDPQVSIWRPLRISMWNSLRFSLYEAINDQADNDAS
jgi:hypothetical protein